MDGGKIGNLGETNPESLQEMDELNIENYMFILREDLERYVKINKLSYEALGDSIGVSGQALRDIVSGTSQKVSMDTWFKIRRAMHLKTYAQRPKD